MQIEKLRQKLNRYKQRDWQNEMIMKKLVDSLSPGHPDDKYERVANIRSGGFGSVFRANVLGSKESVAIKTIPVSRSGRNVIHRNSMLLKELLILQKFRHPNITAYKDSYLLRDELWIVMELVDSHALDVIARTCDMTTPVMAAVCKGILEALRFLHGGCVIHRDIKGQNVLVSKNGEVKVADFGLSTKEGTDITPEAGTIFFMAPEVVKGNSYSCSCDIWSMGMTLVQMITGEEPYCGKGRKSDVLDLIVNNHLPVIGRPIDPDVNDFLHKCLTYDPKVRATASQLLQHCFLSSRACSTTVGQHVRMVTFLNSIRGSNAH